MSEWRQWILCSSSLLFLLRVFCCREKERVELECERFKSSTDDDAVTSRISGNVIFFTVTLGRTRIVAVAASRPATIQLDSITLASDTITFTRAST